MEYDQHFDGLYTEVTTPGYVLSIREGPNRMDPECDDVDVEVRFHAGERYVGSLQTLNYIQRRMADEESAGVDGRGVYYYWSDLVIVKRLTVSIIVEIVEDLIQSGDIACAFTKVDSGSTNCDSTGMSGT